MDFGNLIGKISEMSAKLQEKMETLSSQKKDKEYKKTIENDGLEITIVMNGVYEVLSIIIGESFKSHIVSDPDTYFPILTLLLITAFNDLKVEIDSDNTDASGGMEDIMPAEMKDMLNGFGGFDKLLK